jgi:hypothetical protein
MNAEIVSLKPEGSGWLVEARSYDPDAPVVHHAWYADESEAEADYLAWQALMRR